MYGINQNTQDAGKSTEQFKAGVHDNCTVEAVFEKLSEDKDSLLMLYIRKTVQAGNATVSSENREVLWPVNPEQVKMRNTAPLRYKRTVTMADGKAVTVNKGEVMPPDVAVQNAFNEFNSRIKHVMGAFLPEQETYITGVNSYAEYAQAVVKKLADHKDVPVRVALTYKTEGPYTEIPRYGLFIEPMTIAREASRLDENKLRMVANVGQSNTVAGPSGAAPAPPAPAAPGVSAAPPPPAVPSAPAPPTPPTA